MSPMSETPLSANDELDNDYDPSALKKGAAEVENANQQKNTWVVQPPLKQVYEYAHPDFDQLTRFTYINIIHFNNHRRLLRESGNYSADPIPEHYLGVRAKAQQEHEASILTEKQKYIKQILAVAAGGFTAAILCALLLQLSSNSAPIPDPETPQALESYLQEQRSGMAGDPRKAWASLTESDPLLQQSLAIELRKVLQDELKNNITSFKGETVLNNLDIPRHPWFTDLHSLQQDITSIAKGIEAKTKAFNQERYLAVNPIKGLENAREDGLSRQNPIVQDLLISVQTNLLKSLELAQADIHKKSFDDAEAILSSLTIPPELAALDKRKTQLNEAIAQGRLDAALAIQTAKDTEKKAQQEEAQLSSESGTTEQKKTEELAHNNSAQINNQTQTENNESDESDESQQSESSTQSDNSEFIAIADSNIYLPIKGGNYQGVYLQFLNEDQRGNVTFTINNSETEENQALVLDRYKLSNKRFLFSPLNVDRPPRDTYWNRAFFKETIVPNDGNQIEIIPKKGYTDSFVYFLKSTEYIPSGYPFLQPYSDAIYLGTKLPPSCRQEDGSLLLPKGKALALKDLKNISNGRVIEIKKHNDAFASPPVGMGNSALRSNRKGLLFDISKIQGFKKITAFQFLVQTPKKGSLTLTASATSSSHSLEIPIESTTWKLITFRKEEFNPAISTTDFIKNIQITFKSNAFSILSARVWYRSEGIELPQYVPPVLYKRIDPKDIKRNIQFFAKRWDDERKGNKINPEKIVFIYNSTATRSNKKSNAIRLKTLLEQRGLIKKENVVSNITVNRNDRDGDKGIVPYINNFGSKDNEQKPHFAMMSYSGSEYLADSYKEFTELVQLHLDAIMSTNTFPIICILPLFPAIDSELDPKYEEIRAERNIRWDKMLKDIKTIGSKKYKNIPIFDLRAFSPEGPQRDLRQEIVATILPDVITECYIEFLEHLELR